jgi:hypothetical protein
MCPAEAQRGDEIGELARALTQARDDLIEERQRREQSERMALLGRVATGLAHEIKNPLASIQLHAQLMDAEAMDAESAQSLQHVQSEARVIEGLVNQWLYLTRPVPPKMLELDASEVLMETVAALKAQADHANVQIRHPALPRMPMQGDRTRLQQVFRNILLNGIQAMPRGGELEITPHRQEQQVEIEFVCLMRTLLFLLVSAALHANDWPQWLGPQRDGVWRETGIVEKFPEGGPKVLWRVKIGGGYTGPAIANGKVYLMDRRWRRTRVFPAMPLHAASFPARNVCFALMQRPGRNSGSIATTAPTR